MSESETVEQKYPLSQIYFYLTEGCNLACRHCWIAPKYQTADHSYPSLKFDLFRSILEQAKPLGLTRVKLTGGEPLMHPQIRDILELIRASDFRLGMETNGVLCTPELAGIIAICKGPTVSVSLDGVDAETHEWVRGVKGCFEAAVNGIRNLVDVGLKPQIIMTIMRHNKHQMEAMVRLAESLGAGSVKFNLVQPTARGEKMHEAGETLAIAELVKLGRWADTELRDSTNLPVYYHHPAAFRPLGRMYGENGEGCGTCGIKGIIGVLSDGSYALCGIGTSVPELVFGRADTDQLEDVWNNNPVLKQIREGLPDRLQGICADCIMKSRCLGSCIAQNYYRAKSLWAPFWFCEQAYNGGLFPESRMRLNPVKAVDRVAIS
jgi:SynChlorMet cassette radical SAM/SPASM protein ScmF